MRANTILATIAAGTVLTVGSFGAGAYLYGPPAVPADEVAQTAPATEDGVSGPTVGNSDYATADNAVSESDAVDRGDPWYASDEGTNVYEQDSGYLYEDKQSVMFITFSAADDLNPGERVDGVIKLNRIGGGYTGKGESIYFTGTHTDETFTLKPAGETETVTYEVDGDTITGPNGYTLARASHMDYIEARNELAPNRYKGTWAIED